MWCETFQGDHYQIGLQIGQRYGPWIERTIAYFIDFHRDEFSDAELKRYADSWQASLEQKTPELLSQLRGIAEGAKARWEDILAINFRFWNIIDQRRRQMYPDVFERKGEGGCSNIAYKTAEHGVLLGGSLDDIQLTWQAVRFAPKSKLKHIAITWVGSSWACRGINEKGLALGSSNMPIGGTEYSWDDRFSDFAMKHVLENAATVTEAEQIFHSFGPYKGLCVVFADSNGDYKLIETCAAGEHVHENQGKSIFCVNHVKSDELKKKMEAMGYVHNPTRWSQNRFNYLAEKLSGSSFEPTLDSMKEMLANHGNFPDSMCHKFAAFVTIAAPEMEPKGLWIANGPSCRKEFVHVDVDGV